MIENIESILQNPVVLALITISIVYGVHKSKKLEYEEFMALQKLKKRLFPILDKITRDKGTLRKHLPAKVFKWPVIGSILTKLDRLHGRPLVRTKGRFNDPEEVMSLNKPAREVGQELRDFGFSFHLIATLKRIPINGDGWLYAHSQYVYFHEDGSQTEVFLFEQDGITSVYAHNETSVTDPEGHLEDKQIAGDPKGVVTEALG